MALSRIFRVVRMSVNGFAGVLMVLFGFMLWYYNPLWSILMFLAAIDQFEDVAYYAWGKRIIPKYLMPLDILFEGAVFIFGLAILFLSATYYSFFQTWFWEAMFIVGFLAVWSALEDAWYWFAPSKMVIKVEVCEKRRFKFIRREE